ncbi:MAG: serine protease [Chitinophagaceae bacterium]
MLDTQIVADSFNASRTEFADLFMRSQYNIGIKFKERINFESTLNSGDARTAIKQALELAKATNGLYEEIIRLIRTSGMDDGALVPLLKGKKPKNKKSYLEGLPKKNSKYWQSVIFKKGYRRLKWTGKIIIDNVAQGSGILIGPRRFLTAWHVVKEMFDAQLKNNKIVYKPKDKPPVLQVEFDDFSDEENGIMKPQQSLRIDAAPDWLEVFSSCHADEYKGLPANLNELKDFQDYAVILLDAPADEERNYAEMDLRAIIPSVDDYIFVFQYAGGYELVIGYDTITTTTTPVPDVRFLHLSATDHGSSGAPCFDREMNLVGLHQGEWPINKGKKKCNRGIPLTYIIRDIQTKAAAAKSSPYGKHPEDYIIWYLDKDEYTPVIGIDNFQFQVLDLCRSGKGNMLLIKGDSKSGKTYCIKSLNALLNANDHCKIILPGEEISKMDVLPLAEFILDCIGDIETRFDTQEAYNSTKPAWLRDEMAQKVVSAISLKRNNRMVWLLLSDLNNYEFKNKDVEEFLLNIYANANQFNWLQVVLDGYTKDLPAAVAPDPKEYTTAKITQDNITTFMNRVIDELGLPPNNQMAIATANVLFTQYQNALKNNPDTALGLLNELFRTLLLSLTNQISK